MEILIKVLTFHSRIHVRPNQRYCAPGDSPSLIGNLDGNILFAFDDDDLDGREVVFTVWTIPFDDRSQRIFEQLEADVGQVARNVAEVEVFWANQLNWGAFEHPGELKTSQKPWHSRDAGEELPVMFLAYISRVLNRLLDYIVDILAI